MKPLNGIQFSADVQAVMVHFIIIGRSHLRERKTHEGEEGTERNRQTGEMKGADRQERTNRRRVSRG